MIALWLLGACGTPSAPADVIEPPEPPAGLERFIGSEVFRGPEPKGAIVLLHGSEGGTDPYTAELAERLSKQGLVTASFCWFGCEGLPEAIHHVSLDRTVEFVEWFAAGPADGQPITLFGGSRGAEQALLIASLLESIELIDGVAVHAPSDTVVAAYDPRTRDVVSGPEGFEAAWTWHGEPRYGERAQPYGSGPDIEIEKYPGPLYISHGEVDSLWPADRSRRLAERRKRNPALTTELRIWEGEGHGIQTPKNREAFEKAIVGFATSLDL